MRMKELRLGMDVKQVGIEWDIEGQPQGVAVPFPLPEGTFSMHVRHGDKGLCFLYLLYGPKAD
jgi:hypothetical protein